MQLFHHKKVKGHNIIGPNVGMNLHGVSVTKHPNNKLDVLKVKKKTNERRRIAAIPVITNAYPFIKSNIFNWNPTVSIFSL